MKIEEFELTVHQEKAIKILEEAFKSVASSGLMIRGMENNLVAYNGTTVKPAYADGKIEQCCSGPEIPSDFIDHHSVYYDSGADDPLILKETP